MPFGIESGTTPGDADDTAKLEMEYALERYFKERRLSGAISAKLLRKRCGGSKPTKKKTDGSRGLIWAL
jgi:hypothetical protein